MTNGEIIGIVFGVAGFLLTVVIGTISLFISWKGIKEKKEDREKLETKEKKNSQERKKSFSSLFSNETLTRSYTEMVAVYLGINKNDIQTTINHPRLQKNNRTLHKKAFENIYGENSTSEEFKNYSKK